MAGDRDRSMLVFGLRQLFGGARRGQPGLAGLGAALTAIGWMRSRRRSGKELIYSRTLKPGETIKIRMLRGDGGVEETEVEG